MPQFGSLTASTFSFGEIFNNVGLTGRDVVDVVIVAVFIYVVIRLLRETHSVPAFVGIMSLLIIYGVTLLFDLPLTHLVLKSLFGIFVIFIAIIFQKELRRFFSSFGFFGVVRKKFSASETTIDIVSRTVFEMAAKKTGALIVFPGREPIERHLVGGFYLNGTVSEPLLLSIFDDTSPGHDGALVIEGNKIKKFAAHLPLADKIEKTKKFGLRHRAALGLAERTDALVVVVSQERGAVTLAENGEFLAILDESGLRTKIADFIRKKFPTRIWTNLSRSFGRTAALFGVSLAISLAIWFLANSQFILVQRNFAVSPEFKNIPANFVVSDTVPQEVALTIEGRSFEFESLQAGDLRIVLDLSSVTKSGWHKIVISQNNIKTPLNFSLVNIDPKDISIDITVVQNANLPQKK